MKMGKETQCVFAAFVEIKMERKPGRGNQISFGQLSWEE